MNKLKVYLPIFVVALIAIAAVSRVASLRKIVTGAA